MQTRVSKQQIASLLPPDPVVLEAGAHIGRDTQRMSKLWPKGIIHAFEPVPALFKQLSHTTQDCDNVHRYNRALSDTIGTMPLYVSNGRSDACSSLLPPKACLTERPDIVFELTIEVAVTTIDAWATTHNADHIDFMWLDLQGAELKALHGAQKMLPTTNVILVEVNLTERYHNAPLYNQIKAYLTSKGFKLQQKALHHTTWGDALFVRI